MQAAAFSRVLFNEAFTYAHKRKTFGQRLVDHPVIRNKLAHMARQVEATHGWLENITFQLSKVRPCVCVCVCVCIMRCEML